MKLPLLLIGSCQNIHYNTSSLPEPNIHIFSQPEIQETDSQDIDHNEFISHVDPMTSSDTVLDTLRTTQKPHLDGKGAHARVHPNDTITKTEASPVFTRDSVPIMPS